MPKLEPFLLENHFTPEQIRFALVVVEKVFRINQSKKCGVSEKEIQEDFQKNNIYYSLDFIKRTLEKLATTKAENDMDCAVLACVNGKWWCVTGLS